MPYRSSFYYTVHHLVKYIVWISKIYLYLCVNKKQNKMKIKAIKVGPEIYEVKVYDGSKLIKRFTTNNASLYDDINDYNDGEEMGWHSNEEDLFDTVINYKTK